MIKPCQETRCLGTEWRKSCLGLSNCLVPIESKCKRRTQMNLFCDGEMADETPRKRRKTNEGDPSCSPVDRPSRRSISPPPRRTPRKAQPVAKPGDALSKEVLSMSSKNKRLIASPIQLNNITELPASSNVDTVSLRDILGDPLISECWLFNYLFDVDFLL